MPHLLLCTALFFQVHILYSQYFNTCPCPPFAFFEREELHKHTDFFFTYSGSSLQGVVQSMQLLNLNAALMKQGLSKKHQIYLNKEAKLDSLYTETKQNRGVLVSHKTTQKFFYQDGRLKTLNKREYQLYELHNTGEYKHIYGKSRSIPSSLNGQTSGYTSGFEEREECVQFRYVLDARDTDSILFSSIKKDSFLGETIYSPHNTLLLSYDTQNRLKKIQAYSNPKIYLLKSKNLNSLSPFNLLHLRTEASTFQSLFSYQKKDKKLIVTVELELQNKEKKPSQQTYTCVYNQQGLLESLLLEYHPPTKSFSFKEKYSYHNSTSITKRVLRTYLDSNISKDLDREIEYSINMEKEPFYSEDYYSYFKKKSRGTPILFLQSSAKRIE